MNVFLTVLCVWSYENNCSLSKACQQTLDECFLPISTNIFSLRRIWHAYAKSSCTCDEYPVLINWKYVRFWGWLDYMPEGEGEVWVFKGWSFHLETAAKQHIEGLFLKQLAGYQFQSIGVLVRGTEMLHSTQLITCDIRLQCKPKKDVFFFAITSFRWKGYPEWLQRDACLCVLNSDLHFGTYCRGS